MGKTINEHREMMTPAQQENFLRRVQRFKDEWSYTCDVHPTITFPEEECPLCGADKAMAHLDRHKGNSYGQDSNENH